MSTMGGQQYPYDRAGSYGGPRGGMPAWAWALIGCGVLFMLLVVVLAAILFPVFAQARNRARTVACRSNEKQSALAVLMYAQDYDQSLPRAGVWMDGTLPYVKSTAVYHCPSVEGSVYGYAFNTNASQKRMDKLMAPAQDVMLFDSMLLSRNATDTMGSLPNPPRHGRANNIAFVDGHVRSTPPEGTGLSASIQ